MTKEQDDILRKIYDAIDSIDWDRRLLETLVGRLYDTIPFEKEDNGHVPKPVASLALPGMHDYIHNLAKGPRL